MDQEEKHDYPLNALPHYEEPPVAAIINIGRVEVAHLLRNVYQPTIDRQLA